MAQNYHLEAYFAQAERFLPDAYDPDRWLASARRRASRVEPNQQESER